VKDVIMMRMTKTTALLGAALLLAASPALAADEDEVACEGLTEGAPCTEADGETGTCRPDASSGVLECEDADDPADDAEDADDVDDATDDAADRAACEGKSAGDACKEADGEAGVCRVDDDGGTALECESDDDDDDGERTGNASSASTDAGGGCNVGGGGGVAGASAGLLGLAVAAMRRRSATRAGATG
jgi:hypothetical protein